MYSQNGYYMPTYTPYMQTGAMPDMLNPKLTASWEKGLDMVAKKEIEAGEFMTKLESYIKAKINKLVIKR